MARRKLLENIFSLGALQAATYILPLLLLPYLAKVLGADQLGRMAFALAFANMFVVMVDYGFNLTASRDTSIHREDVAYLTGLYVTVTGVKVGLYALGALIVLALTSFVSPFRDAPGLFWASYLLPLGNILFPVWFFQGIEELKLVAVAQILSKLTVFCGVFFLVKERSDLILAGALQASAGVLAGMVTLPILLGKIGRHNIRFPAFEALSSQVRTGFDVFLSNAAIYLYTTCNPFLLGMILPPAQVAQFHIADRVVRAVQMLISPVSSAVYPHVSRLASESRERALSFNKKLLGFLGGGAFLCSLALLILARPMVEIAFGSQYEQAADLIQIMSFMPLCVAVSNVLGIQTMMAFGLKRHFSRILILSAMISLSLFVFLVHVHGLTGAAVAAISVEAYVAFAMFWVLTKLDLNPLFISGK